MQLTRRGWLVLAVVAASLAMSWQYGPRSLNAVVTPLAVAFVVGLVTTARVGRPTVRRHAVEAGPVGETRTVAVTIETDGAIAATVADTVGDGLEPVEADGDPVIETTVADDAQIAYDVTLEDRGERAVGPLSITVSDVFGLVERTFEDDETVAVLVYPPVRDLRGSAALLQTLAAESEGAAPDREEFDRLREYRRGDSLRNVHWKAAAKRPDDDLVVAEYATADEARALSIAAECEPGPGPSRSDELATAVASLATHFLERDRPVGVTVGTEAVGPAVGRQHRRDLLELLAAVEPGELEDRTRDGADVLVRADRDGVRVVVDERAVPFERLVAAVDATRRATGERAGGTVMA
ncbi:DUF58 domain-containing protein [Halopiger xanaduensis]|uniref:Uncharacterized protein n=1 Tax=Halopiger xanaduensis (strain DSM 18323 / JCM 14033 / SH-6) TaxID=797210 RepID=F8D8V1_HALXS|nr:DUF58 domain-containing protein [Halopiger xanaduensis]AEH38014.1 protein of unknown function DUF58 [Halopiger xanaduensis SH-6]